VGTGARTGSRLALQGVVVASVVVGAWFLVFHVSPRPVWHHTFDLRVYRGAVRWWLHGHPLYDFVRPHTEKGFTYPPFAVLVLLPLALGTETTATVLMTAVSGGLILLTTWWLVAPVAVRHAWPRWVAVAVAVPVVVAMEPVRETLGWGQIDLVIAALVLADVVALRRGRPWAGVGIGLATAIKVTPGLFLVYLAVTRRWRAAGIAAVTFGIAALVGLAVDPSIGYWARILWETGRVGPPDGLNDQSLLGLLARLTGTGRPGSTLWLALAVPVLVVGIARAALLYRRGDDLAGLTVTGLTACLISPISWVHHLYWVVPAVVVLVDVAAGTPVAAGWARARPRAGRAGAAVAALVVAGAFAGSLIWFFAGAPPGARTIAGENAYVLLMVALVLVLPAREGVGDPRAGHLRSTPTWTASAQPARRATEPVRPRSRPPAAAD
jgi:alpha-1,2-mannosyltransferase